MWRQGDEAEARRLRLERQKKKCWLQRLLLLCRRIEEQAHEELWTSCAEEVKRVCDSFGLALRRVAVVKAVSVVSAVVGRARNSRAQQGKKREERPESEESDGSAGKKAKAVLAEEEANDDDEASGAYLSSSSEQQESRMAVEDAGDEQEVLQAFQRARADAEKTVAFLREEMRGKSVEVGDFVAPDAAGANAAEGRKVLRDDALLSTCICKGDDGNGEDLERLGLLQRWWRLIWRCYAVIAVFEHLAATKKKKSSDAFQRNDQKDRAQCVLLCSGKRLERIGRLVLRYLRLVYQTQFTFIRDWCYKLHSTVCKLKFTITATAATQR